MQYPLTHPENFGKWHVKEFLAAGGQFSLYVVTDSTKDNPLERLLKTPFTQHSDKLKFEADLLDKLDHPNIIGLIDKDLEGDPPYEVTEYGKQSYFQAAMTNWKHAELNGQRLKNKIDQIADAVGWLHSQGITHNSLTQTHIVICEDQTPKLIHFEEAEIHTNCHCDTSQDLKQLFRTIGNIHVNAASIRRKIAENRRQRYKIAELDVAPPKPLAAE